MRLSPLIAASRLARAGRYWLSVGLLFLLATAAAAHESLWIEAEHFDGIRGYCWPMGPEAIRKTDGHWGLSGPGWAAEWNQGGESGFLSIATGAADDRATVSKTVEIPVAGKYFVWVRYGDWREKTERFQVRIEQEGAPGWTGKYGEQAVIDEDNEAKLYWGWAFVWDSRAADLKKGASRLSLVSTTRGPEPRQIDAIVLTTDPDYRPRIKERPPSPAWEVLNSYRRGLPADAQSLARNSMPVELRDAWKLKTFHDKGFLYLWNVNPDAPCNWLSDDPNRLRFPYNVADDETRKEFEKKYGGKDDVPIFSDPRVVPTFHGVGAGIFATDPATGEVLETGKKFARWLDEHPERSWGMMMNYHPGRPVGEKGIQLFQKYRDRFVGSIAGESHGYFSVEPAAMQAAIASAETRRKLAAAFTPLSLAANAAKYRAVYGKDLDANAYADVISCLSVGNIAFAPLCYEWGARTAGYESSAMSSSLLGMRWAFMRGAARQHAGLTATYRSCNFGDSSTIFSKQQSYTSPQNLLDNYYSVFSGAGMTWYKMDIWYQYMAGSSMFYHEQGFDEFWRPGGTTVAGIREVELSPKGKLVDRFLRVTREESDRGHPVTPVAFLVDHAAGWEPSPFWPNAFNNYHGAPDRFRFGDHEQMLHEYFWTAYHPIGPESERPMTGTNEVYVPGVFGDIFDCVFATPDMTKWTTLDTYPVVIAAGEIELTAPEGARLARYVEEGGTLLVADAHLTGPGVAALQLPATDKTAEADGYRWLDDPTIHASPRFRCRPIATTTEGWKPLAQTAAGESFCAALDRGKGRLIYLAVPYGMSITRQALPVLPRLFLHLTRGLMPVEVAGDVEWLVNRTATGYAVTLLNPAGQLKPQQGITAADYRENRLVTIHSRGPVTTARDRLLPDDKLAVEKNTVQCEVPAGGVRIIDLR
jgi:hypothetical protein